MPFGLDSGPTLREPSREDATAGSSGDKRQTDSSSGWGRAAGRAQAPNLKAPPSPGMTTPPTPSAGADHAPRVPSLTSVSSEPRSGPPAHGRSIRPPAEAPPQPRPSLIATPPVDEPPLRHPYYLALQCSEPAERGVIMAVAFRRGYGVSWVRAGIGRVGVLLRGRRKGGSLRASTRAADPCGRGPVNLLRALPGRGR